MSKKSSGTSGAAGTHSENPGAGDALDSSAISEVEFVRARVLVACAHGSCDDVVEIDASLIGGLAGVVDADPAAVAYAESLTKE